MYNTEAIEKFNKQYKVVFNDNGEIKVCGRDACKELISLAEKIDKENAPYGDHKDGFVNIDKMHALYEKTNNQ